MKALFFASRFKKSLLLLLWGILICTFQVTISTTICLSQEIDTLWSEDWEGNWIVDWHVDGGTWEVGVPTSGPDNAYNGQKCAATVLGGNYSEPVDSRLIRHTTFVVPPDSENPRLRFWHWYSFSDGDSGVVQLRVENGPWRTISPTYTWTGSGVWSYPSIDLSAYADSTVQIAFYFHSERIGGLGDVSSGWYIDDVAVITGPVVFNNPENFESGIGDWAAEMGTWEVGMPTGGVGPDSAHSPSNCAGTVLDGNYAEPVDSRLISPPFLVPSADQNPRLRFWHWYSFSDGDSGVVQLRVENGPWRTISPTYTWTGSGVWSYPSIDLSAYADSTVQIAFYFHSERIGGLGDVSSGWYIDDVRIEPVELQITVTSPKGREVWIDSCSYPVSWNPSGFDHIRLLYSIDCGSTYVDTIAVIAPDTGSYTWTVPFVISSTVRVKAQAEDASDSVLAWDESDTNFTATLKGDVNSDCGINILDIIRMVNCILYDGCTPHELWAGDVNCDGRINILDIITEVNCILYGSENCLFCIDKLAKVTTEKETETAVVSILDAADWTAGQVVVPIGIEARVPVAGVQLSLAYNEDDMNIDEIQPTERSKDLTLAWKAESGELTILLYSLSGKAIQPGNGPIVEIPFQATKDEDAYLSLNLREVILADEYGQPLPTRITEAQSPTPLPKEFALSQNYPNPFNSTTLIRYAIPDRDREGRPHRTTLKIYNISGQLVKTLVDGQQEAGYHSVRWDSRDQAGREVASGIYFYRLKAGNFTATRKMVLMR